MSGLRERRQERLLALACECLAGKPDASLNEIADYAGVGVATLHRYFGSRDGLMRLLSHQAIRLVQSALDTADLAACSDFRTYLERAVAALLPLGNRIYFLQSEVFKSGGSALDQAEDRIKQHFILQFKDWQARGQLRADLPADWLFRLVYSLLFAAWQAVHEGSLASREAAGLLAGTLLDGIASPAVLQ